MGEVIVRKKEDQLASLTDSLKYKLLLDYSNGTPPKQLAEKHRLPLSQVDMFLKTTITSLSAVRETNKIGRPVISLKTKTPVAMMNQMWLDSVDHNSEQYAYYYATTGSNLFALTESKLDLDLPSNTSGKSKNYILGARGRYLRSIPEVNDLINNYRDQRVRDSKVGKSLVQSELIQQIEELKELSDENPRFRSQLLKAIELLGKTEDVFSDTVNINDTSTKTGMELLMAKVEERKGKVTYEQE